MTIQTTNLRHVLMISCAMLTMSAVSARASAQTAVHEYAIAQQSLASALQSYSLVSGQDVAFDPAVVAGKTTSGVAGRLADADALILLLKGTGLRALRTPSGGLGIVRSETGGPQFGGPTAAEVGQHVDEIIVTGTRAGGVRASDSAAPVQVVGGDVLKRVGQPDIIAALAQTMPSVQAQGYANDQAAFHPTIKLRGLNPNDTLILIDGKRRHGTSSVTVASNVFGGSAAADILLIPEDSIDHIEVLQDGAAAQYGTDAIAGVVNIITKKKASGASLDLTGGKYFDQGGQSYDVQANFGVAPIDNSYINLTAEHRHKGFSNRGDLDPRVVDTGVNTSANTGVNGGRYNLARFPGITSQPGYPYVNGIVGDGELDLTNVLVDAGYSFSPVAELYTQVTYSYKEGETYQNYRLPTAIYGKKPLTGASAATSAATSADIPFPTGFNPLEQLKENDVAATAGLKGETGGTTWDLSSTYGYNKDGVYVIHSANAALYYDTSTLTSPGSTPTDVHNGDFVLSQWVNNLDLTHKFSIGLVEPLNVAAGLEYRHENFQVLPGELASYYVGSGVAPGAIQAFAGYSPVNATNASRDNFSQYLDFSTRPIEPVLIDGAVRHEHYSDFGDTTVFKLTGRYDVSPIIAVRGTASTGFRAPTLPEEYYSGIGGTVTTVTGEFAPNSPGAKALGINGLKPEKSTNFSAGLVFKPMHNLTMTLDAYSIKIEDRIVRSTTFYGYSSTPGTIVSPAVLTALRNNGVAVDTVIAAIQGGASGSVGVAAFVNGVTSQTQGVDFLTTYQSSFGTFGRINWSLAANYNDTEITHVNAPPSNLNPAVTLVDAYAKADLTKTTPKFRVSAGALWSLGRFSANLRESFYGESYTLVTEPTNGTAKDKLAVEPAVITDLELGYQVTHAIKFSVGANNLANVYPTKYPAFIRAQQYAASSTLYVNPYPGFSPFGINGGYYYGRISMNF